MSSSLPGVSVIVCCHNSASRLPETLRHVARQELASSTPWEVILVDNGSTDGTTDVARRVWSDAGAPTDLRVVVESRVGLSYARQTGIAAARHEVLVLADDDNWLGDGYLATALDVLSQHPEIGVLGGVITPAFQAAPPNWFRRLQSWFAVGPQAKASGDISSYKSHIAGAGLAFRKSRYDTLTQCGFRFLLSDRQGSQLTSGGDTELCLALALLGYRTWYDERLRLTHFLPDKRLSRRYLLRLVIAIESSAPVIACYEAAIRRSGRSGLTAYLSAVRAHTRWALKSTAKLALRRESLTACGVEWVGLGCTVLALPRWLDVFAKHYDAVAALRQRFDSNDAVPRGTAVCA